MIIISWIFMICGGSLMLSGVPAMFFWGAGGIGNILYGGAMLFFGYKLRQKRHRTKNNIAEAKQGMLPDADYSHVFEDFAIAVSQQSRKVYLAARGNARTYDFSDIRSWHYNLESGGGVIGGGMTGVALSVRQDRQNKENSGFFVKVKDVDHPEWQIRFPYNGELKKNLLRWMEIFEQKVNNQ